MSIWLCCEEGRTPEISAGRNKITFSYPASGLPHLAMFVGSSSMTGTSWLFYKGTVRLVHSQIGDDEDEDNFDDWDDDGSDDDGARNL